MVETRETELRGYRALWRLEDPIPAELRAALQGESVMLSHLLYCRGYRTPEDIRGFFAGAPVSHDPFLLPDMEAAVQRIGRAVREREPVAVYGDFDCDGITAAAVLQATLQRMGLDPVVYIPTREDGHGLHPEGLAGLADRGITLVITADCGITAMDEVQVARAMGLDVVVTDHHEARADGSLPDCPAVDPTRHDSLYPFRSLSGAGVAYKLAQAMRERLPDAPDPDELLDLVALGTVADVVPLRGENRSIVIRGLERLQRTTRPGLTALYGVAGVDATRIDPVSVSFYLAPRINAANRMATPDLAYDLITAADPEVAATLASRLSAFNEQRQAVVESCLAELVATLGDPVGMSADIARGSRPPVIVVVGSWVAGISGLLASKLVEAYGVPAFVGTDTGDGVIPFSARGVPGAHIDEMLEACETSQPGGIFLGYGGHSRAGGFRVAAERLEPARLALEETARALVPLDGTGAVLGIDAEVRFEQLTVGAGRQLSSLAPFGMEFGEPLFLARSVVLRAASPLKGDRHARVNLQQGGIRLDAVLFHAPPAFFELRSGAVLDLVFHFGLNEWNGLVKPQLSLRDWRLSPQP